jgi:hypothetical protein
LYLVATFSDSETVIYYALNPQICYIELVGHAARWTKKRKRKINSTVLVADSVQYMRRVYLSTSSSGASPLKTNAGRASFRKFENPVVLQR